MEVLIGGIIAATTLTAVAIQIGKSKNEVVYASKETAAREVASGAIEALNARGYDAVEALAGTTLTATDVNLTLPKGVTDLQVTVACSALDMGWTDTSGNPAMISHCGVTATASFDRSGTADSVVVATNLVEVP